MATVLAYIDLVKNAAFPEELMTEVERLHELEFFFKESSEPMHAAKSLATNLKVGRIARYACPARPDTNAVVRAGRRTEW